VFFTKKELRFKTRLIPVGLVMIGLLIALMVCFYKEELYNSLYWATYVFQFIILQFCVIIQLFIDFCRYPLNKRIWQIDYLYRIEVKKILKAKKKKQASSHDRKD